MDRKPREKNNKLKLTWMNLSCVPSSKYSKRTTTIRVECMLNSYDCICIALHIATLHIARSDIPGI